MTQTVHSLGQTIGRADPDCSPDLRFVEWSKVEELVRSFVEPGMRFLDVGGRHGEFAHLAEGCVYVSPKVDELGGWREHRRAVHIGRARGA